MKFIDLFAGLGGFHIALRKHGMECVFASEINEELRGLYSKNFDMECHGDVTGIQIDNIPAHDILCAGFPCQPFSKAGKQKGLKDVDRGNMIFYIVDILKFHKPKYFILENVSNLRGHDQGKTWETISELLSDCDYSFQDYILSPHHFGVPNKRERMFVLGHRKELSNGESITFKEKSRKKLDGYLEGGKAHKRLNSDQTNCLKVWQKYFIQRLSKDCPMPKFPIWAMEFGANYPLDKKAPYYMTQRELESYKGAFGVSLKGIPKREQLVRLPVYASYNERKLPRWKVNYIQKNRDFWKHNKKNLKDFIPRVKTFVNSWQKLEWNAGDDSKRDIFEHLLQFRSSGIRIKKKDSVPSFVLTGTQTPIIGWEKRYLSVSEAQRLQGFDSIQMVEGNDSASFKALGNAVNTVVVENIVESWLKNRCLCIR